MQEVTRDAIVSLAAFAGIFGMVYIFFMTRHRERMAILERNLTSVPYYSTSKSNSSTLKYGMLLAGIGIGFIMGWALYNNGMEEGAAYISMTSLFGGIGLIGSYIILQKQKNTAA